MGRFRHITGSAYVTITSADCSSLLRALTQESIILSDVIHIDELRVSAHMYEADLKRAAQIIKENGGTLRIRRISGILFSLRKLLIRPVFALGLALFIFASIYMPGRVFFVQIEGNENIPSKLILEKAEACGVVFGTSRRAVRSEKIKNALISSIPQLQWVGINTRGCVATISVREKSITENDAEQKNCVTNVVASRDGVVESTVVHRGNLLCSVGQAVSEGQILVSGYTDCGNYLQATKADAEIYARTNRDLHLMVPSPYVKTGSITRREIKYSLLVGKKLINFYDSSGISDVSCVKMYEENYWSLPGGFSLPVAVVKETWTWRENMPTDLQQENEPTWICESGKNYVSSQMIAGEILCEEERVQICDGYYQLDAQYACLEMISKSIAEEALPNDGEDK